MTWSAVWAFIKRVPGWVWLALVAAFAAMGWRRAVREAERAKAAARAQKSQADANRRAADDLREAINDHAEVVEGIHARAEGDLAELEERRTEITTAAASDDGALADELNRTFGNPE